MRLLTSTHCLVAALLCSALVAGCASVPRTHYYMFEFDGSAPAQRMHNPKAPPGHVIGVETFLVDPPYDQDRIVYRVGSGSAEVGFYEYHRWAVPLSRMLPNVVAEGLRGTPGIASIEPSVPGRVYAAYLDGRVLSLEEIDTPQGRQAHVEIALTLRLDNGTVVWSSTLIGETTTQVSTVGAIVEQMRTALSVALAEGRTAIASALTK